MKIRNNIIYLIAIGFFSILGQVVLLRELNVAFYGIELIYILSFAFWLLGTAIGASIGRRSHIPQEITIHIFFLISAILLIADIIFVRGIRNLFGAVPGGYLPFSIQITGLLIALIPAGILAGLLFQWIAKRFIDTGNSLAKAYTVESAGGVLGALASTLFLSIGVNNFASALISGLVLIVITAYYSLASLNKLIKFISVFIGVLFLILFGFSHQLDLLMTSWDHPYLLESVDTPYNRVTVTSPEKQICVFEDDVLGYETETVSAEEFVQMSTLQATNFNKVLVLGGGYSGIIYELLKLPTKKIDYVELNPDLIQILQKHLPQGLNSSLRDKKVNVIFTDPIKFLNQQHFYNIILVGMPEPMSAQTNRFYTKEFFKKCVRSLDEKGILAFKLQSSENIWTEQMTVRNAGIYNAVKSAFRNVVVLPGVVNIFIASNSKLSIDTGMLIDRFKERNLETRLVSPQYINYIYTNDRFSEIQNLLSLNSNYINSDFHPVCYGTTISLWLTKFFPGSSFQDYVLRLTNNITSKIIIIIILLGGFFVIRKSPLVKRFVIVMTAGFMGMVLEIILILLYQNKNGILFRDIGLLIMAFMAGLTIGSFFIVKLFQSTENRTVHFWTGNVLLICFAILILIIYLFVNVDIMNGLVPISFALLIDGILVSGIFGFVSLNKVSDQKLVISQLYTADLIGGSLGSLIASLVLIPIFGFFFALIILIIITGCCLIYINA